MTDKVPMTKLGFEKLEDELRKLKNVERHAIVKAIGEAREHGDLSENAEYHAARERQSFVEGRILELEAKISRAEIIDATLITGTVIKFGATVTLIDADTEEEIKYQVVGDDESNVKLGLLSVSSPLARALINKTIGDMVELTTPKGAKSYEVTKVLYK